MFGMTVGITGRVLVRLLDMARKSYTSPDTFVPGFSPPNDFARTAKFENGYNTQNYAQMAGLGGASGSEAERILQDEIDVIFIILCKNGRIWPMASEYQALYTKLAFHSSKLIVFPFLFAVRQAKAIAGQLGVNVASPELLRYGLFTDRNAGNHIYR